MRTDRLIWIDAKRAGVPQAKAIQDSLRSFGDGKLREALARLVAAREDSIPRWLLYNDSAAIYIKLGLVNVVIDLLERAIEDLPRDDNSKLIAIIEENLGIAFSRCNDFDPAIEHFRRSVTSYISEGNHDRAESVQRLIEELREMKAMGLHTAPDADTPRWQSASRLAQVYYDNGDPEMAECVLSDAIKGIPRDEPSERDGIAMLLCQLGITRIKKDNPEDAQPLLEKAASDVKIIENEQLKSTAYSNLGVAYRHLGLISRSRELLQKARILKEELADLGGLATVHYNLARLELAASNHRTARAHVEKAIEIDVSNNPERLPADRGLLDEILQEL